MKRRYFLKLSAAGAAFLLAGNGSLGAGRLVPRNGSSPLRVQWQRADVFSAFDAQGHGYEIEPLGGRVVERGTFGLSPRQFGSFGLGRRELNYPVALAFGPDKHMYVVDHGNSRIQVYDSWGRHVRQIGRYGSGESELSYPRDLAFDRQGRLWVADSLNNRIQVFDRSGTSLARFGEPGTGLGRFNGPVGLVFATDGNLHVLDGGNRCVQVFSSDGEPRASYGTGKIGFGRSIAIGHKGGVYVADTLHASVEVFGNDGRHQQRLKLRLPDGRAAVPVQLAFAPVGDLYVTALAGPHPTRHSA